MNRDMAFEQKVRDMLNRGECDSYEQAEFKTKVKEGYARLGEIAQSATRERRVETQASEAVKKKIAQELRDRALNPRGLNVQNYFDIPR